MHVHARAGPWGLGTPGVGVAASCEQYGPRLSPIRLVLTRCSRDARARRSWCSRPVSRNTTAPRGRRSFSKPGFLKVSWARGSPGEGRAQARRAAQAQCGREDGGRVQVSGGARKRRPGCECGAWRRAGGQGGPECLWSRRRALPVQALRDGAPWTGSTECHAFGRDHETFEGALLKPRAAHACNLQTRVCYNFGLADEAQRTPRNGENTLFRGR